MSRPNRRRVLQVGGAALAAALAGCQDDSSNSTDEPSDDTGGGTTNGTPTGTDDGSSGQNAADLEPVTVAEDWHMYQVDAQNTGFTENTMPSGEVEQRWQFSVEDGLGVPEQPILADGTLYLVDGDGVLRALDPSDGTEKWSADRVAANVTPAYADGTVYINGKDDSFEAFDPATGDRLWRAETYGETALAAVDGMLYGSVAGIVVAADASNGERQWSTTLSETGDISGAVAVADGRVFASIGGGVNPLTAAIDAESGNVLWQHEVDGLMSAPTVADGSVFTPRENGTVEALDPETGEVQWSFQTDDLSSGVNYTDGSLYLHGDSHLTAVDANSGDQQWQVASSYSAGILSPDGLLCTPSGNVAYHDRATGERQWSIRPDDYPKTIPVVANGLVFVGGDAGLTAYQEV